MITRAEARRLREALKTHNVFIKVPVTSDSLPVIQELISGRIINV